MMKLVDGPAKGTYMVKRAPQFLRAVFNDKGGTDVLDQLADMPTEKETVVVYQRRGEVRNVHVSMANRRKSGFYVQAEYVWMPNVEPGPPTRTADWELWLEGDDDV